MLRAGHDTRGTKSGCERLGCGAVVQQSDQSGSESRPQRDSLQQPSIHTCLPFLPTCVDIAHTDDSSSKHENKRHIGRWVFPMDRITCRTSGLQGLGSYCGIWTVGLRGMGAWTSVVTEGRVDSIALNGQPQNPHPKARPKPETCCKRVNDDCGEGLGGNNGQGSDDCARTHIHKHRPLAVRAPS